MLPTDAQRLLLLEQRLALAEQRIALLEGTQGSSSHPTTKQEAFRPTPNPGWKPVLHQGPPDHPGCGGVALYLTRLFSRTEKADLSCMRTGPTLSPPKPGEPSICISCDQPVDPFTTQDLYWGHALIETPIPAQTPSPTLDPIETTTVGDLTGRLEAITDAIGRARSAGIIS